jgi:hypothetical protein
MSNAEASTAIPSSLTITAPDRAALVSSSTKLLEDAKAIVIDSNDMLEIANDELAAIKGKWKALETQRDSLVRPLNDTVRAINTMFRGPMDVLVQGEQIIKSAMLTYTTEQERKALEERRRLEREAEERRLQAEKEAAEAREKLEEAAATGSDEEVAVAQAQVIEAEQAASTSLAPIHYVAAAPRLSGTSVRKTWKARLPETDEDKLKALAFIVVNPQFLHLVEFSQSECNKLASAMKANMKIDGIVAYQDSGITARAR